MSGSVGFQTTLVATGQHKTLPTVPRDIHANNVVLLACLWGHKNARVSIQQ
jgi:hypothetical protein